MIKWLRGTGAGRVFLPAFLLSMVFCLGSMLCTWEVAKWMLIGEYVSILVAAVALGRHLTVTRREDDAD